MRHDRGNKHNGQKSLREKMKLSQSAIWLPWNSLVILWNYLVTSIDMSMYLSIILLIDQE